MLKCRYCQRDYFAYKIYYWDSEGKEHVKYKCAICEDEITGKELQERVDKIEDDNKKGLAWS